MKELTQQEQYILLTILELGDKAFLNNIRDGIREVTGKEYALGTIYVPLERLKRLGYLHVRVQKPEPKVGGRSIKYYRLTREGLAALAQMKKIQDRIWANFAKTALPE